MKAEIIIVSNIPIEWVYTLAILSVYLITAEIAIPLFISNHKKIQRNLPMHCSKQPRP